MIEVCYSCVIPPVHFISHEHYSSTKTRLNMSYCHLCAAMLYVVFISTSEAGYTYHGNDNKNYADAKNACAASGQILAMPKTESQQTAVADLLAGEGDRRVWIGLRRDGGQLKWADGSDLGSWTFWRGIEPSGTDTNGDSEDCVHMRGGVNFKWNDNLCSRTYTFLCEGKYCFL